jgi:predicted permease
LAEIVNPHYLLAYTLGSLATMAIGIGVAYFGKKRDLQTGAVYGLGRSMSNSGFSGYPIAQQLVGPSATVALAMTMIEENLLMLPLAMVFSESGSSKGATTLRHALFRSFSSLVRSPIILSIAAGVIFTVLKTTLPEPVTRALDMAAMTSAPTRAVRSRRYIGRAGVQYHDAGCPSDCYW